MNEKPLISPDLTALAAERRQVTVLFADMAGFTAISERLGEEGTYELIQPIYELMVGAVKEEGGSVHHFTGDGIMVLFGVPNALEDAPLRACRAGLLILDRIATATSAIEGKLGARPQIRIGINTGSVVVTTFGGESTNATALGDAVNLASRLQGVAEAGTILLGEATHRLVQGLVEASFAGSHSIRGKAEPQNIYYLTSIRKGASRFQVEVGRGLSPYVGRERELDVLEGGLAKGRGSLQVIDVMAEPGMGKSRLVHEFCQRVSKERAFVLSGSCTPDGRQTPFLPFIEVVRGSFQVTAGEAEEDLTRKLETGLAVLGLHSLQNVGLLLNLLGVKPPEGALAGLDGVLVGLRTRELLQRLLEARCHLSPVVMLIEDLHWIDSASGEMLHKIISDGARLALLILHTRRPEYEPVWLDQPIVTKLQLEPLSASDIQRVVQARLGVDALPEAIAQKITEKAEGNALFAEEIVSFLTERGVLRTVAGKVEFNIGAMVEILPASLQNLLTERVDRLDPQDRALLQSASIIGRRFDPQLLEAVADDRGSIHSRLAAMQASGLVSPEGKSGGYAFKHTLVRDALYQSLLTESRASLHLRIAEEIERRSLNRLTEVTEILAYHYAQTNRDDKAFTYTAMAGAKCLGIYSLDDAGKHVAAALRLLARNPNCACDQQVAEWLANATFLFNILLRSNSSTEVVERFMPRIDRLGDGHTCILVRHHYLYALILSGRFREADKVLISLSSMAYRLRDARSIAYALASELHLSTFIAPKRYEDFVTLSIKAIAAATDINDAYLQYFVQFAVGWDELHRGRSGMARAAAENLIAVGRRLNDPRPVGLGLGVLAWNALTSDDYPAALEFAETSLRIAQTPLDREGANLARNSALVLLRSPGAFGRLREWIDLCKANGWRWVSNGSDGIWGVALVAQGEIGAGLRWMEQSILRREQDGYRAAADWYRMNLCEIYLQIISGSEKSSGKVLVRNALSLATVMLTGERRISLLIAEVRQSRQFDPNGHYICRCEMIMGLLYKAKRKPVLAVCHLTEAKRIALQFGPTPMLARIDTALAELA